MDNPGWSASRRAKKDDELYNKVYRDSVRRGRPPPPVPDLNPIEEDFIGGWKGTPLPPKLPPKDWKTPDSPIPSPHATYTRENLTSMSAVERSRIFRAVRMDPHLQFMCGPLLKYDTVDDFGIWHGAALIVTADSGSIYDPHPVLTYSWDPKSGGSERNAGKHAQNGSASGNSSIQRTYELPPHPADPHSTILPVSPTTSAFHGPNYIFHKSHATTANGLHDRFPSVACTETTYGQEIWVYCGTGGTFTFWRFLFQIPLAQNEMVVQYSINKGQQLEFFVPGRNQNMRWAAHSCNGFSAGINPDDFRGPGYKSGYDPVWMDLLASHAEKPFHCLVGGGDQIYCDRIMREPELQEWISLMKPEDKIRYPLSDSTKFAIDRFFFTFYCQHFRTGAFARANCSIPMLNMCDDHDLIDGFGSYPDDLQSCPVFRQIGARGYFFFLLFQCFINVDIDGVQDSPGHIYKSLIIGQPGPYVQLPSHTFLTRLGPRVYMLLLDCRAERRKDRICSLIQYRRVFDRLNNIPQDVDHLIVQLGIPIAYPRMVFLESALESKFNPLVLLGRSGSLGLSGFVNKFNAEAELLDDLNDHWTARSHKKERNWFIEQMQHFAQAKRVRVSFISGDVHCAALGCFQSLKVKGKPDVLPSNDFRYMLNIVTSAIVNTPPPDAVLTLVSSLATKTHKTLHSINTDEIMIPLFNKDPNGQLRKQKFIMGRRNWCNAYLDETTGDFLFDIRVEKEKGHGVTVGYPVRTPPPRWEPVANAK